MPNLPAGYQLVNIDHHITNRCFGDFNLVMPEASSASEILYRFFAANEQTIDAAMATSLMTGVLFDTTYFKNDLSAIFWLLGAMTYLTKIPHSSAIHDFEFNISKTKFVCDW